MKPFVLAHVSDLHTSTFGDTLHDRRRVVKRSLQPIEFSEARYQVLWDEAGWRVVEERARRGSLHLLDPEGYVHPVPSLRASGGVIDPVERAASKACRLEARRASTLAKHPPSPGALEVLQAASPKNSNLRLLHAAEQLRQSEVDAVIITGDLTDNGDGYELVESVFRPWRERGRLFAVPGNHDLYLLPLAGSVRPRPTHESKRRAWRSFAAHIGLALESVGAWYREIPEAETVLVGLDSCIRAQKRFFRQNGAIGAEQLAFFRHVTERPAWRAARHRIVALHHHVMPLPHGVGRGAPTEIGMRLDDAREVAEVMNRAGVTFVLHGHRHVSEYRQPAGSNFGILACPSLTLGCRSGDSPSYWRIELGPRAHVARERIVGLKSSKWWSDDSPESEQEPTGT